MNTTHETTRRINYQIIVKIQSGLDDKTISEIAGNIDCLMASKLIASSAMEAEYLQGAVQGNTYELTFINRTVDRNFKMNEVVDSIHDFSGVQACVAVGLSYWGTHHYIKSDKTTIDGAESIVNEFVEECREQLLDSTSNTNW